MTIPRTPRKTEAGFTLVELSIVIVLMGVLLTLGLAAFNAQMQSSAGTATRQKQQIIKDALIAYLRDHRRLPCPELAALNGSVPIGVETRSALFSSGAPDTTTACPSYWGTVPYTTLGISREVALDGYGNLFTYFVSNASLSTEPDWTITQGTPAGAPGFSVGNPGRLAVTENDQSPTLSSQLAAVVIISHGANAAGAYTVKGTRNVMPDAANTDELANVRAAAEVPGAWSAPSSTPVTPPAWPNPAVVSLASRDRTETFDDIVMVLRPNDLLTLLIRDGAFKSAQALLAEQLASARDAGIASMLPTSCALPSTVPNLPIDPWGSAIQYARLSSVTLTSGSPTPTDLTIPAFSVSSVGPDRIGSTSDDTTTVFTFGDIRFRLPTTACP